MAGFEFPPPETESGDGWENVDYPRVDRGGSFILPPPRSVASADTDEIAQRIAGEISWIRETARDAGEGVGELEDRVQNLGVVVEDYGPQITDLIENRVVPWAVPTVAPLSESLNRRADPTFQLQGFMALGVHGETEENRGAGGLPHAHELSPSGVEHRLAEGWTEGNRTYLAFITPAVTRAYEEINFMVGAVSGTPANMDIAIYVTDENRVLTSQIGVIRISDEIGPGRQLVTRRFPTWVATQGSYIAVAVRQHAAGNQRPLLGLHDTPRPLSNVTFPRKITAQRNSTSALPGTIDGTNDLNFEADWFTPYIELSEAIGVDYRTFNESWGNDQEATRPWVTVGERGVYSNPSNYATPWGFAHCVSLYDTPLSTDYIRVHTSIGPVFTNNNRTVLAIRTTNDMRSGVGVALSHHDVRLIEWVDQSPNNLYDNRVDIRSVSRANRSGDQVEVDYLDGRVTIRINGTVLVENQSVGGPQGAAGRFLGIRMRRTGNIISDSPSPWIGPWSARDLPQSNGDDDEGSDPGEDDN